MHLVLIRHGQTQCNREDIWHGWDDCELTEVGRAQAEALASRLESQPIAAVYSSDIRRAMQTAETVARPHSIRPESSPAFRERSAGEFEGLSTAEVVRRRSQIWEERAADYWGWSPPGGETFYQVRERTVRGLERLKKAHAGETIALVGHMGTVRVLICHLAGVPMEDTYSMEFPSTGVSTFRFDGDAVHVETLNDAAHIAEP